MATIKGTGGDDFRVGTDQADFIQLFGGDDTADGRGGNDQIYGGPGNDVLFGFHGRDALFGNAGDDVLIGENQNDALYGGSGNDLLRGALSNDHLYGGDGSDALRGERDDDVVYGGNGNDECYGGSGPRDALTDGNDIVYGGGGDDIVVGERGYDLLFGGAGRDFFLYVGGVVPDQEDNPTKFASERDIEMDFHKGEDQIEILNFDFRRGNNPDISFSQLDSNHNHVLDNGDADVEIRAVTVAGYGTRVSTVIDAEAALGLHLPGENSMTIFGVTGLTAHDVFS